MPQNFGYDRLVYSSHNLYSNYKRVRDSQYNFVIEKRDITLTMNCIKVLTLALFSCFRSESTLEGQGSESKVEAGNVGRSHR